MATNSPTSDASEYMLELLSRGVGLGAIFGYTETEYAAVYALGHSHYSQERYLDAARLFGFLVMHSPMERRYMSALASALQMLGHYRDAIQYHSMASIMDIEDPLPTFHTAECLMALEMRQEAREALALVLAQCNKPQWQELQRRSQMLLARLDTMLPQAAAVTP